MSRSESVVITGGSSGLGLALAEAFASQGASLTLLSRDLGKLEAAAAAVRKAAPGAKVRVEAIDVADEPALDGAMQRAAEAQGGIDMLVNSAGILREGYFETVPMATFREVMETNYFGLIHATKAALPHLKKSRGRLVNIASIAGLAGAFGYTAYCASKHALIGLSQSLRYELRPQGVHVHVVCPFEFDSPMVEELDTHRSPENRAQILIIPKTPVETIVKDTLSGLRKGRFMIIPGRLVRLAAFGIRHFPGPFRVLSDRTIARVYRGPAK
jgi:3-dehydrosphinganine reductase